MPGLHSIIAWCTLNLVAFISWRLFAIWRPSWLRRTYTVSLCLLLVCIGPVSMHSDDRWVPDEQNDQIEALLDLEDEELLEEIQKVTFSYFWDFAHPVSGMIRERNTSGDLVTSGGSGFGVMAILVGIHRGFISREEGRARVQKMVTFLSMADRFKGAWPHWMNGQTGRVIPFSAKDNGGDLVETSFLLQGLLTARSYFDEESIEEEKLRTQITTLWEEVNWNWYRKQVQTQLFWHWSPEFGFDINLPIRGWNETMIAYILGIASPTHRIPPNLYDKGWAGSNYENGQTFYGYKLSVGDGTGGPLFFTHYSFLGLDPRGKRDAYANYFFHCQNQTLVNRAYCISNPENHQGYGANCWGLTASDDPDGYRAHAPNVQADNGTITPSAAIGSIVYTPEESIAAIRHFLATYREKVWGPMGFYDAFNLSRNWFATSYLAIDQGPIICMIENFRSGLLWEYFMRNQEITDALAAVGFVEDTATTSIEDHDVNEIRLFPIPSDRFVTLISKSSMVNLNHAELYTSTGELADLFLLPQTWTQHTLRWENPIPSGQYYLVLRGDDSKNYWIKKILIIPTSSI